jgi:hypothetical protein
VAGELVDDPRGMSPYGPDGRRLGLAAVQAADLIGAEPDWDGSAERRWLDGDHDALEGIMSFLRRAERGRGNLYVFARGCRTPNDQAANRRDYADNLHNLFTALPFSEAERHWLGFRADIEHGVNRRSFPRAVDVIRRQVADVYEAGRSREVNGRKVLDAFWAWRREVFEFEAAGSLDVAVEALRSIGQILLQQVPEVASYEPSFIHELQVIRDARRARREGERAAGDKRQAAG